MSQILIIEDHENISKPLKEYIENEGYNVEVKSSIKNAKDWVDTQSPDLIILDWMLGDGQGIDFLKEYRRSNKKTPIIFLTARVDLVDKVLGLELGANDYMTKPFEIRELLARIRVQLREIQQNIQHSPDGGSLLKKIIPIEDQVNKIKVGPLEIDRIKHKVTYKNKVIDLVKKEFDLLVLLSEHPDKVFSRDEILNKVWGYEVFPTTRTVDSHVLFLRQKIDSDLIETVRSVGYRLKS